MTQASFAMTYTRIKTKSEFKIADLKPGKHVIYSTSMTGDETERQSGFGEAIGRIVDIWQEPRKYKDLIVYASPEDPYYLILNYNTHRATPFPYRHLIKVVSTEKQHPVSLHDLKVGERVLYHPTAQTGEAIGIIKQVVAFVDREPDKQVILVGVKEPCALIENEVTRTEVVVNHDAVIEILGQHVLDEKLNEVDMKSGTKVQYFVKDDLGVHEKHGVIIEVKYGENQKPVYLTQAEDGTEHEVKFEQLKKVIAEDQKSEKVLTHFKIGSRVLYHPDVIETTGTIKRIVPQPNADLTFQFVPAIPYFVIENDYTRKEKTYPLENIIEIIEFIQTD